MKRFAALLSAAAMFLSMTGCGRATASMINLGEEPPPLSASAFPDDAQSKPSAASPALTAAVDAAKCAVALASYPAAAAYPNEDDFQDKDGNFDFEAYNRAWEAWQKVQDGKPSLPEDTARLKGFFRDSLSRFLSGGTESRENRVCSPVNIYMALCMLAEVTDGESRGQILRLLGADSMDALRKQANQLWNALYTDDGTSTLLLGSSLWMNEGIRFREDTMKRLAESYYASSFSGNPASPAFTEALRSWLNQQTRGLLEKQAGGVSLTRETVLALAATLYYKAPWLSSFGEANTYPAVFHAPGGDIRPPFLHQTFDNSNFYAGDGFTAMPISLAEGSMWLILPEKDKNPDTLLKSGAVTDLLSNPDSYLSARGASVKVSLPKFDVSADLDLCQGLRDMGVKDVFDRNVSNFTPMTTDVEKLEVSKIQHAARVKIDENGCEAAAYTVAMVELTAAMPMETTVISFNLDRPFLFAVAEGSLPLFAGVVNVPDAS